MHSSNLHFSFVVTSTPRSPSFCFTVKLLYAFLVPRNRVGEPRNFRMVTKACTPSLTLNSNLLLRRENYYAISLQKQEITENYSTEGTTSSPINKI
jgi:hypothetical protein